MNMIIRQTRYFRLLELCAVLAAAALIVFTGISMKWIGFSRMLGMYLGVFFLPIALLEICAVFAERYRADRMISKSTLFASFGWTLFMILPITLIVTQSSIHYQRTLTSEYLWRTFPDSFPDLVRGSAIVVALWLVPAAILSGFLAAVKRMREEQIRWAMILWQCSFLLVIAWALLFHREVASRVVHVAEEYFSPLQLFLPGMTTDNLVPFDTMFVLIYWCLLFVALRYVVKYFGVRNSVVGFVTAVVVATAVVFLPPVPALPKKAFVDFVNFGGWYPYRLPHLVPLRIWVASIALLGGTVLGTGIIWLLRRENGTVHSG